VDARRRGLNRAGLARRVALPRPALPHSYHAGGRGCLDRAFTVPIEQEVRRVAQPFMERLVTACKETVNLGILDARVVSAVASRGGRTCGGVAVRLRRDLTRGARVTCLSLAPDPWAPTPQLVVALDD
jgi:hypothetical protein